uniref:Tubulin tyrosine ligase-like family, member 12 n=1 Tax=Mus musculus TaxID=10090 RepID=F2Z423_MOUSE
MEIQSGPQPGSPGRAERLNARLLDEFVSLHGPTLRASGVPERLWGRLLHKLEHEHLPHRPCLDVPCGACTQTAAAGTWTPAPDGQPHGHRVPWGSAQPRGCGPSAGGDVEIQPDLSAGPWDSRREGASVVHHGRVWLEDPALRHAQLRHCSLLLHAPAGGIHAAVAPKGPRHRRGGDPGLCLRRGRPSDPEMHAAALGPRRHAGPQLLYA